MSSNRMISSISSWMKSKHLQVPDDWIAACLDWISSENHNTRDEVVVRKMVYEQYLLTDLRDFGIQVLPHGVTEEVFDLKGIFCVQIDSVLDVSQPKYSQLLQRQNKESGNTFVTAETQVTQKPWEAKPTRILMLKITDGVQEISGMEYNSIPKLSEKTPPGTKMCLKGLIKCRRGVLMLKQQNVDVLGGEVEDLLANNNYEANLCRGLGRPVPTNLRPSSVQNNPTQLDVNNEDLHDILADAEFDDADFGDEIKMEIKNVPKNTGNKMDESDPSLLDILADADNDNFMDFDDNPVKSEPKTENVDPSYFDPFTAKKMTVKSCNKIPTKTTSSHNKNVQNSVTKAKKAVTQMPIGNQALNPNPIRIQSFSGKELTTTTKSQVLDLKEEDIIEILDDEDDLPTFEKPKPWPSRGVGILTSVNSEKNQQKDTKREYEPVKKKFICPLINNDNVNKSDRNLSKIRPTTGTNQMGLNTNKEDCGKFSVKVNSDSMTALPTNSVLKSSVTEEEACSHLCHAKKYFKNSSLATFSICVKGIVITLTSKLKSDTESGWSIGARICDGTEVLEVEFNDSVLRKLIGFSASEIDVIKQCQNSADKLKLKSGVENCRETIISMCHYMHINLKRSKSSDIIGIVTDVEF